MATASPAAGAIPASLAAGPLFVAALFIETFVRSIPEPVAAEIEAIPTAAMLLATAVPFGFFLAIVPNLIGAAAMSLLAERYEAARSPAAWIAAGAAAGAGIAMMFGVPDLLAAFPITITAAICARICRAFAWEDAAGDTA